VLPGRFDERRTGHAERVQPTAVPNEDWNKRVRHETPVQRLDRNWSSLLQELRVVQTGVQLLTGFLLTLPFQSRFDELTGFQRGVYLVTVLASITATILLVAPVGMHRLLFRQRRLPELVVTAHRFAMAGLLLLGVAMAGVVVLVVGLVVNTAAGIAGGIVTVVLFLTLWVAYPWRYRR